MKHLTDHIKEQYMNESIEGQLQTLTHKLSDKADESGMIKFKKPVALGENDARFEMISVDGNILALYVGDESDAVDVAYFSDTILKDVIDELKKM